MPVGALFTVLRSVFGVLDRTDGLSCEHKGIHDMARSLVIVESPAKAKTINRYLGKDFVVKSSVGHIRDLPTGGKAVDPKARAKEAQKTKALTPAKREAYKKKRARDQLCLLYTSPSPRD